MMGSLAPGACAAEPRLVSPERQPVVVSKDERLTVDVQDVFLGRVLEEISRVGRVTIVTEASAGRERVSIHLDGLPLDEALRRILRDHDAFFYYSGVEPDRPASLRMVWVYPRGRGRGLMPIPAETWASTKEFERDLLDADPATRARAIATVVRRRGERARDVVLRALADPDDLVRSRTLYTALRAGLTFSSELLTRLVLEDSSAQVRFLALEALEARPAVIRAIAGRAVSDPDLHVRNKAQEILKGLDRAARRARPVGAGLGAVPR